MSESDESVEFMFNQFFSITEKNEFSRVATTWQITENFSISNFCWTGQFG